MLYIRLAAIQHFLVVILLWLCKTNWNLFLDYIRLQYDIVFKMISLYLWITFHAFCSSFYHTAGPKSLTTCQIVKLSKIDILNSFFIILINILNMFKYLWNGAKYFQILRLRVNICHSLLTWRMIIYISKIWFLKRSFRPVWKQRLVPCQPCIDKLSHSLHRTIPTFRQYWYLISSCRWFCWEFLLEYGHCYNWYNLLWQCSW